MNILKVMRKQQQHVNDVGVAVAAVEHPRAHGLGHRPVQDLQRGRSSSFDLHRRVYCSTCTVRWFELSLFNEGSLHNLEFPSGLLIRDSISSLKKTLRF